MYGLKEKELQEIKQILSDNHIGKAILFGSRAKGNYSPGSDVDLAIIGNEKKLSDALNEESRLVYYFDIINLEKIKNKNLKEHIYRVGKEL
jgi:predicted nucleotidyltransferase